MHPRQVMINCHPIQSSLSLIYCVRLADTDRTSPWPGVCRAKALLQRPIQRSFFAQSPSSDEITAGPTLALRDSQAASNTSAHSNSMRLMRFLAGGTNSASSGSVRLFGAAIWGKQGHCAQRKLRKHWHSLTRARKRSSCEGAGDLGSTRGSLETPSADTGTPDK